jgi:uncharacterized protein
MTLLDRHVGFVAALRAAGLAISVAEDMDAVTALRELDLADRAQLRSGYAAALVKRQAHRPAFDTVFELFFPAVPEQTGADDEPAPPSQRMDADILDFRAELVEALLAGDDPALTRLARVGVGRFGSVSGRRPGVQSWSRYAASNRISPGTLTASLLERMLGEQDSDAIVERTARTTIAARIKRFEQLLDIEVQRRLAVESDAETVARTAARPSIERRDLLSAGRGDLIAIRREIAPLARRLAARLAIQQRRGRRGPLDFRHTMRASLSSGGVPIETVHKPRRPHKTDLVVLCDVSESVSAFARFTLLLLFALREQFSRVRVFAFVDELDEITALLDPAGDIVDAVERVTREAKVTGWYGRTDYGRSLGLFAERHLASVTSRTSVLILGDARSNYGEPNLPALARIAKQARRTYWLNPERRDVWDTGDSCATEVSSVVPMLECRNLAQLGAFVRDLV